MIGIETNKGFIDFANVVFNCPSCKKKYNDIDDKYLNRCNRNKSGFTKINCDCGNPFFMTYDYKGDAVSFKP
ncbi:MAG: hypothetical protein ACOCVF_00115 [bacterium]